MSPQPEDPRDRLLADTLHGDWAAGPASAMAQRAAASVRRRRAVRRGAAALSTLAVVALAALAYRGVHPSAIRHEAAPAVARTASVRPSTPTASAASAASTSSPLGYEIVSDEELFALVRDRPLLLLPEEKGPKKIVVLAH